MIAITILFFAQFLGSLGTKVTHHRVTDALYGCSCNFLPLSCLHIVFFFFRNVLVIRFVSGITALWFRWCHWQNHVTDHATLCNAVQATIVSNFAPLFFQARNIYATIFSKLILSPLKQHNFINGHRMCRNSCFSCLLRYVYAAV